MAVPACLFELMVLVLIMSQAALDPPVCVL